MSASETNTSPVLQQYLSRLDASLVRLSEPERREILLETQSHVAEQARRSPELSVPEILEELGTPEDYAGTFLVDPEPQRSPRALPRRVGALHGIARLATGSWTGLPLLLFVLSCYSVAVFLLFIALMEILEPANTGLIVQLDPPNRTVAFAASDPLLSTRGPDVLGGWIIPIGVGIAMLIHLAMSALLRRVLPRDVTPRSDPPPSVPSI